MAAPLAPYTTVVAPDWIDCNGHMNLACHVLAFDRATDAALATLGLDAALRETHGNSVFVAETRVVYERELAVGAPLRIDTQILGHDDKRLLLFHTLHHATEGWLAACTEILLLHVNLGDRRVCAFPAAVAARLAAVAAAHAMLPQPAQAGRPVALRRRGPAS